jgi:hypothetical protein
MSQADDPTPHAAPEPPPLPVAGPPQRNGRLTAFLVLVGLVLLLPGLCTMAFFRGAASDSTMSLIALITFVVALGGIALLAFALLRTGRCRGGVKAFQRKAPADSASQRKMPLDLAWSPALCHCFLAFPDYIAPQCMRCPVWSAGLPFWGKAPLLSPSF